MAECKECLHYEVCSKLVGKDKIDRVSWMCHFPDQCSEFKSTIPKTQADRIRAMSDEELAELFGAILREREIILLKQLKKQGIEASIVELPDETFNAHLEWLKQPAEGE